MSQNRTVKCLNLRAGQMQKHLEDGTGINMEELET